MGDFSSTFREARFRGVTAGGNGFAFLSGDMGRLEVAMVCSVEGAAQDCSSAHCKAIRHFGSSGLYHYSHPFHLPKTSETDWTFPSLRTDSAGGMMSGQLSGAVLVADLTYAQEFHQDQADGGDTQMVCICIRDFENDELRGSERYQLRGHWKLGRIAEEPKLGMVITVIC